MVSFVDVALVGASWTPGCAHIVPGSRKNTAMLALAAAALGPARSRVRNCLESLK
jgi:hypothetical protein